MCAPRAALTCRCRGRSFLQKDLRHAGAPGLAAAVAAVSGGEAPPAPLAGEVWFTPAPTLYEECRTAACRAAALAREGVAYGDMAFICRDMQQYSAPLLAALELAGVPVFRDVSLTLEHSAVASFFPCRAGAGRQGPFHRARAAPFEDAAVRPCAGRHRSSGGLRLHLAAESGGLARPL